MMQRLLRRMLPLPTFLARIGSSSAGEDVRKLLLPALLVPVSPRTGLRLPRRRRLAHLGSAQLYHLLPPPSFLLQRVLGDAVGIS